jgi:spore coat protein U-like protein
VHREIIASAVLFLAAGSAHAITECLISTTLNAFGEYDDQMPNLDSNTGGVTVACTVLSLPAPGSVPYQVRASTGTSGSYSPRRMRNTTYELAYNLYIDGSRSVASIWGDGSSGTQFFASAVTQLDTVGVTRRVDHVVYGRIPAGQRPLAVGTYGDSMIVTLTF